MKVGVYQYGPLKYILLDDYKYYSDRYDITIEVPKGFIWDGSSGDFIKDLWLPSSCVHDYLYRTKTVSKWKADMIYYDILKKRHPVRAVIRLIGLKLLGWKYYG